MSARTEVRRRDALAAFRREVLGGLNNPQKSLPSRYFYDERGSRLFDEICGLEEYYLTRTEIDILDANLAEMAEILGPEVRVIEPGAGSGIKTEMMLGRLDGPVSYIPIDVSESALSGAVERLSAAHPGLEIMPVVADFMEPFEMPDGPRFAQRNVVFFPGSTIGNFVRPEAGRFLRSMSRAAGADGAFVLGVDLLKEDRLLELAYNDARGVTAEFNRNLLRRINRELSATFRVEAFRHEARFDAVHGRIEMHLVSDSHQQVRIGDRTFFFEAGETILTEYSHKYRRSEFEDLCRSAGLETVRWWTDRRDWFGVALCAPRAGG